MSNRSSLDLKNSTEQKNEPEQLIGLDSTTEPPSEAPSEPLHTSNSVDLLAEKETIEQSDIEPIPLTIETNVKDMDEFPVPESDNNDFPVPDDEEFDEFGEFDNDFADAADDDFGDFDDFEEAIESPGLEEEKVETQSIPQTPTEAELYVEILEHNREEMSQFIESYLHRMWEREGVEHCLKEDLVSSPIEQAENPTDILNTPCR